MKTLLSSLVLLAAAASTARAQDLDAPGTDLETGIAAPFRSQLTLGPRAGFLKTRDADDGTWFAGVQMRLHLVEAFAIEGSITFHRDEFQDGDIAVTQYPVEVTALYYLFQGSPVRPYVLGGIGWYYTKVEVDTPTVSDESTTHTIGGHLGFGVELGVGAKGMTLNADLRYIFLKPDEDNLEDEKFDAIQVSLGLNFPF